MINSFGNYSLITPIDYNYENTFANFNKIYATGTFGENNLPKIIENKSDSESTVNITNNDNNLNNNNPNTITNTKKDLTIPLKIKSKHSCCRTHSTRAFHYR